MRDINLNSLSTPFLFYKSVCRTSCHLKQSYFPSIQSIYFSGMYCKNNLSSWTRLSWTPRYLIWPYYLKLWNPENELITFITLYSQNHHKSAQKTIWTLIFGRVVNFNCDFIAIFYRIFTCTFFLFSGFCDVIIIFFCVSLQVHSGLWSLQHCQQSFSLGALWMLLLQYHIWVGRRWCHWYVLKANLFNMGTPMGQSTLSIRIIEDCVCITEEEIIRPLVSVGPSKLLVI